MDCTCSVWNHLFRSLGFLKKWRLDIDDLVGRRAGRLGKTWVGIEAAYRPRSNGSLNMKGRQLADWWFGTMDFYDFPWKVGNGIIIPTDFRIFFRGVGQPPTSFSNEVRPLNFWRWLDYPRSIVKWNPSNPTPCVGPQWIWFEEKVGPWISFLHVNLPPQNLQFLNRWPSTTVTARKQSPAWVRSRHKSPAWGCRNARTSDITCQGKTTIAAKSQVMSDVIRFFNKGGSNPL